MIPAKYIDREETVLTRLTRDRGELKDLLALEGATNDRLIGEGLTPIARWGEPADIGRAVATLATGGMPFATGVTIEIDGGLHIRRL